MAPSARMAALQSLYDAHPLRIEALSGVSRRLVVSMTSVGTTRRDWPPREFVKIASQQGKNHVICVTDISRSWMNSSGMLDRVLETISDYVLKHGITEVIGIGASMGGFNALVLGGSLPCARIIALSPQYSVHPEIVPDENRWLYFRNQITDWPYPALTELPGAPTEILMVHGDTDDEVRHWSRMPTPANLHHFIFPDNDHNFPRRLRETGDLERLILPVFEGQFSQIKALGAVPRQAYERGER